jgi:hypothetical protein
MFLKGTAVALALAGTALMTAGTANAAGIYFGSGYNTYGRDRPAAVVSIGFGDVAFGYRDGYWDSGHRWHHWRHNRDYQTYRGQNGSNYHN